MSKESALQFLNTLGTNERAKELLNNRKKPENFEEQAKIYSEIAAELGEQITPENFKLAVEEVEEQIRKKAEAAVSEIVALEDDQVEDVAGGFYYVVDDCTVVSNERIIENQCANDFVDTSCWWNDACRSWSTYYYDCSGSFYHWDIRKDIGK